MGISLVSSEGNYILCSSNSPCLRQAGRTVFPCIPFPGFDVSSAERRRFGSFLPSRSFGMPWAELFWPFRPELVYKE